MPALFPQLLAAMVWTDVNFISDDPGKNSGDAGLGGGGAATLELVKAVQKAGYDGPYGVEVLNQSMRSWSLDELVSKAYETTMKMF